MLRREPAFVHVDADQAAHTESRYAELFTADERVTGEVGLTVGDYISRHVRQLEGSVLPEHLEALDLLATIPTARLERLLAEHVDTASHRLDAWRTGLLGWALDQVRSQPAKGTMVATTTHAARSEGTGAAGTGAGTGGLHLGAYGWVEELVPEGKALTEVTLPPDLAADVDKHATVPL